jgi:hypothetical protein
MNFDRLNETDVREEIIAPLIREMGYRSGTENNVLREQSLRYDRHYLGRKDEKKDPPLRGKADYILEAGGLVRWVIEAKAPSSEITLDEVEQAWTYANHPEVSAIYFSLCNGRVFQIYQTNHGPKKEPIFSISYEQLYKPEFRSILENILSPQALLRDHPARVVDTHPPLGPGLRSIARITGGYMRYTSSTSGIPAVTQLQISVIGGAIERSDDQKLIAYIECRAPIRAIHEFLETLKLTTIEIVSQDSTLSTNPESPSIFTYNKTVIFPKGSVLHNMNTWENVTLPENMEVSVSAKTTGILEGNKLFGRIENITTYDSHYTVAFNGEFCLFLS